MLFCLYAAGSEAEWSAAHSSALLRRRRGYAMESAIYFSLLFCNLKYFFILAEKLLLLRSCINMLNITVKLIVNLFYGILFVNSVPKFIRIINEFRPSNFSNELILNFIFLEFFSGCSIVIHP